MFFVLIKALILNTFEKKYFEPKFIKSIVKNSIGYREIGLIKIGEVDEEKVIYQKRKSLLQSFLSFFYIILGVYDNMFIKIEYQADPFYIPRQTRYYIIFYVLFYIENIIFAIILYFELNNNLRIIFFYVFTFAISVLIQILYRKIKIREKVYLYSCLFMN
jgi:hypothetical protein